MGTRGRLLTALSAASLVVAGCTEAAVTGPPRQAPAERQSLLGGLLGNTISTVTSILIPPVNRTTPLASDVSWSFTVGTGGGSSSNSAVGLSISVPAGAVSAPTTITVTALAGAPVAYRFEPHGLVFSKNISLTQKLSGTTAGGLLSLPVLSGAYFATDDLELTESGLATVTEVISASVNLLTKTATFPVGHFSGYILASGRGSSSDGSE
ncbi:MAG: hypothetical protein WD801_09780 [Gemmatimonadaceae bacterium]